MSYAVLSELPREHLLRNTPLAALGAEYRNLRAGVSSPWKRVGEAYGIAKAAFNDLSGSWIENNEWRVVS